MAVEELRVLPLEQPDLGLAQRDNGLGRAGVKTQQISTQDASGRPPTAEFPRLETSVRWGGTSTGRARLRFQVVEFLAEGRED